MNEYFVNKKESIETISVGMGHSIARSKLGYAYMWGDNRFGQISTEKIPFIAGPVQVEVEKQKVKVLQAVAGFRATFIFLENFRVLGMGTSSSFPSVKNT